MSAAAIPGTADPAVPGVRLTGYASLFGIADLSGDVMQPGAFTASLARRGPEGVKFLWQHDPATPLGRWLSIEEDARGLRVTGILLPSVARAREAESLMRAGILDGLSIGFRTVRARSDRRSGQRAVAEVDLWEISLVTFPMLPGARARLAPAADETLDGRLRAAARRLRDAASAI